MSLEQKKRLTNTNLLPEYIEFQKHKREIHDSGLRPIADARIMITRIALNAGCDRLKIKPFFDAVLNKYPPKVLISPLKVSYLFYPCTTIVNETIEELILFGHINRTHASKCGYPVTEAPKLVSIVRRLSSPAADEHD